jgi:hypothetical protein
MVYERPLGLVASSTEPKTVIHCGGGPCQYDSGNPIVVASQWLSHGERVEITEPTWFKASPADPTRIVAVEA